METVVRADYVLSGSGPRRRWLRDAYVVVDAGRIRTVDTGRPPAGTHVDLGESVLVPGLIDLDALVDIDHLILDSWHSPEQALLLAGSQAYWQTRRRNVLTPSQRATLRRYGVTQLALHGITSYMPIASEVHLAWGEDTAELRDLAEETRRIGLRGWLGPSYRSAVSAARLADGGQVERVLVNEPELGERGLDAALGFADDLTAEKDPLVNPVLLPCRIETLTPDLMRRTAVEAAERDLLVRLHSLQQPWERELILKTYGCTPLDLLERTGLLNDRLLIPHALWTDRNPALGGRDGLSAEASPDLRRIRQAGASVVHCPLTTFRYGGVLHTFEDYRRAGINLALGTDSFPPDLIRGIDVGFHGARAMYGHGSATLSGYLDAATTGGAQALRRPDLGRIEPGASADLTAFALGDIRDGVHEDPLRTLVLNGSARNTIWSMVAGRVVVEDGALPGLDVAGLRRDAQGIFDTLRGGYEERDPLRRTLTELFTPTYPTGG